MRPFAPPVLFAFLLTTAALPAYAQNYMPLDTGMSWDYRTAAGKVHNMTICGERLVNGVVTHVRHQSQADQVYENYWSSDAAGNLYLHGAWNVTFDWKATYAPPILYIDSPLTLGKSWVTRGVHVLDGNGNEIGTGDIALSVRTDEILTVPAGTFHAFGLGQDLARPANNGGGRFTLDGCYVGGGANGAASSPPPADDWFCENVGEVRFDGGADGLFDLIGWGAPTGTHPATWGAIKRLFGGGVQSH